MQTEPGHSSRKAGVATARAGKMRRPGALTDQAYAAQLERAGRLAAFQLYTTLLAELRGQAAMWQ